MSFRDVVAALPRGRGSLVWAAAVWAGCLLGLRLGWRLPLVALLVAGGAALAVRHARVGLVVALVGVGAISGGAAAHRIAAAAVVPVTPGPLEAGGRVLADAAPFAPGKATLVRLDPHPAVPMGAVVLVRSEVADAAAGDVVHVAGALRDDPGRWRGDAYRAVVRNAEVTVVTKASGPLFGAGNALRSAVRHRLGSDLQRPAGALLAGFLIGDTSQMDEDDLDDLRLTGLTHFVAVSGSNVALFLGAWWLVVGPFGLDPRLRALTGLAGLAIFVVATRWEPSVVRASTMAAVVLGGRVLGAPVDAWRAMGVAVAGLLLMSGELAADVGFQLSVAATAGVLVGAKVPIPLRPAWVWRIAGATVAAQLAVLPILLARFGTVPLLSPVTNVLAAPLVTLATVLGGGSVLFPVAPLRQVGLAASGAVLAIAEHAAAWPQLGVAGALAVVLGGLAVADPRTRVPAVAGGMVWVMVAALPVAAPAVPELTFLDVGQGDAIVLRTPGGHVALVDGGPDPDVLAAGLERHGVDRLDLVVVTHGDADHVGGLVDITQRRAVGEVWYPAGQSPGPLLAALIDDAEHAGIPLAAVAAGTRWRLDGVELQVLSPARRYAGDNDGSVVLWLVAGGRTVLLTGDVEGVAQADLPAVRPQVLQVPHHGSATTDLAWLAATVGEVAVVSVGVNRFGHPAPAVLEVLAASGAEVLTTRAHGDVTVRLCESCP